MGIVCGIWGIECHSSGRSSFPFSTYRPQMGIPPWQVHRPAEGHVCVLDPWLWIAVCISDMHPMGQQCEELESTETAQRAREGGNVITIPCHTLFSAGCSGQSLCNRKTSWIRDDDRFSARPACSPATGDRYFRSVLFRSHDQG